MSDIRQKVESVLDDPCAAEDVLDANEVEVYSGNIMHEAAIRLLLDTIEEMQAELVILRRYVSIMT